jgi:hypothetical protein
MDAKLVCQTVGVAHKGLKADPFVAPLPKETECDATEDQ